jgi:hypothetical protein
MRSWSVRGDSSSRFLVASTLVALLVGLVGAPLHRPAADAPDREQVTV